MSRMEGEFKFHAGPFNKPERTVDIRNGNHMTSSVPVRVTQLDRHPSYTFTMATPSRAVQPGWTRFAVRLQYHGGPFLGFTQQGEEDCITKDGIDLRGYTSVETCLRRALARLLGGRPERQATRERDSDSEQDHSRRHLYYDNIQVSSRTDRGVHALNNTFHIDICNSRGLQPQKIHRGLNFYLARPDENERTPESDHHHDRDSHPTLVRKRLKGATLHRTGSEWMNTSPAHNIRILNVVPAPERMFIPPSFRNDASLSNGEGDNDNNEYMDWNARFSATQRTYVYRILASSAAADGSSSDWAAPFEWDRSWRVHLPASSSSSLKHDPNLINIAEMKRAASFLCGEHDFSSFRAKGCQRTSPIVNMSNIQIHSQPYGMPSIINGWNHQAGGGLLGLGTPAEFTSQSGDNHAFSASTTTAACQLITILFQGNSFLYRQVRNMTGCLVQVGTGDMTADEVRELVQARDRRQAPRMAPAQGLFLAHVQHGEFVF